MLEEGPQQSGVADLDADHDDQGCCRGDCKSLVVGEWNSGALRGVGQDGVGDKKQHHRCEDALGDADEELPLVEKEVELSRLVQFGILHTPLVRNVLQQSGRV